MKRIDYYASNEPWKMPKWVGLTLGGVFGTVAVTTLVMIVHLTRPENAEPAPQVAAAPVATPAVASPVVTAPPVQTNAVPTAGGAALASVSAKHVKHKSHSKPIRTASLGRVRSGAILARHDTVAKRKQKDDLDRLLGL